MLFLYMFRNVAHDWSLDVQACSKDHFRFTTVINIIPFLQEAAKQDSRRKIKNYRS